MLWPCIVTKTPAINHKIVDQLEWLECWSTSISLGKMSVLIQSNKNTEELMQQYFSFINYANKIVYCSEIRVHRNQGKPGKNDIFKKQLGKIMENWKNNWLGLL